MPPGAIARRPSQFLLLLMALFAARRPEVAAFLRGATAVPPFPRPPRTKSDSKFFLWLTDAHVDPYYGQEGQLCRKNTSAWPLGVMGCDPPLALLQATTAAAAAAASSVGGVEFAVFTGDSVRHKQDHMPDPTRNVTSTIKSVSEALAEMNATKAISVGALGNDDSPLNYELEITSNDQYNTWLRDVGQAFTAAGVMSPEVLDSYSYGGYFEELHGSLVVLTINTVIYSVRHIPRPPGNESLPADPFGQLAWLHGRLSQAAAQGKPVWIMGHIPPGMETYGYTELWHPEYLIAYREIVSAPALASAVAAQLFGHVHADEFRVLPGRPTGAGPILLAGAISPIYRSNPSFRLVEYDPTTGRPLNYLVYYSDGMRPVEEEAQMSWRLGYSALQAYPPLRRGVEAEGAFYGESLGQLVRALEEAGDLWNTFAGWYKTQYVSDLMYCGARPQAGNVSEPMRQACVSAYICGLYVFTQSEYDVCRLVLAKVPVRPAAAVSPAEVGDEQYELGRQQSWQAFEASAGA